MFQDTYDRFAKVVSDAGFYTNGLENMGSWQRTSVCAKRRPGGGYTGNSFWVTQLDNAWYLGTWGGEVYRLPEPERISELCVTWLTREPDETRADFDESLKTDFHLQSVSDEDFDHVTGAN
jgi:hypothetical protein